VFNYNGIPLAGLRLFDSRDLGTPENYWQVELANCASLDAAGGTGSGGRRSSG